MSLHFYILFNICVKWIVCYDYYEKDTNINRNVNNRRQINHNQEKSKAAKNPNAQFDLAGFLNVGDIALGDGNYDYDVKSESNLKDYKVYGTIIDNAENIKKRDDSYFLNGAFNPVESTISPKEIKNSVNSRQFNPNNKIHYNTDEKAVNMKLWDDSVVRSLSHHPEKKCSFKNMKFPFFSHNKSQTNKAKKRKMSCQNCKNKSTASTSTEAYKMRSKDKRSYVQRLCPECRRKFRALLQNEQSGKRRHGMIHNRQYFAGINNQAKVKEEHNSRLTEKDCASTDFAPSAQNSRRKRDEFEDRDRRLQELDTMQKRVDNLEVHMPQFEKPVQM